MARFLNADSILVVGENAVGTNMLAYCLNNPVNASDLSGYWPISTKYPSEKIEDFLETIGEFLLGALISFTSAHDLNRRPYFGEPGSTYTAPNGDRRTYGPDGKPEHDYDHDDHGFPDKHPHDPDGGHNHDWKNGKRGPAYCINLEPTIGVALVTVCALGVVAIVVDDITVVGYADNILLGPLGEGIREGIILIFR